MYRIVLLLLFLTSAACLRAWDDEWQTSVDIGYTSRRVFRGVGRAGSSAETALGLKRAGFRGGVRLYEPFAGGDPGEAELSAGYAFKPTGQLTIEAVATQFLFFATPTGATKRSTEAGVVAGWALREGLASSLAYYRDFRLKADTVQATLAYEVPLTKLGAYLELSFYGGWRQADDVRPDAASPRVRDAYTYWGAAARLPYRVGEHTTLAMGADLAGSANQTPVWAPNGRGGGTRGWVSLAVSFDF
ncbi:MAG: hypothetical protein HYV95_17895 [Opitutae bacterium]|nr:hypothetical protein [Opitutae bacterium]